MTGHVHPLAKAENDVGAVDASDTLPAITLVLRQTPEQQADLDRLLAAQQDPTSPDYHRWLSPEQYADRFGASSDDIAKITAWLEQHNLHVTAVGRARTSIAFTGAAGDVEQALQISFHRYSVNGRDHFANTAEPSLPVALQAAIRTIHGLNDFRMQPKAVLPPAARPQLHLHHFRQSLPEPRRPRHHLQHQGPLERRIRRQRAEDRHCRPDPSRPHRHPELPRQVSASGQRSPGDSRAQHQRSRNRERRSRRGRSRSGVGRRHRSPGDPRLCLLRRRDGRRAIRHRPESGSRAQRQLRPLRTPYAALRHAHHADPGRARQTRKA